MARSPELFDAEDFGIHDAGAMAAEAQRASALLDPATILAAQRRAEEALVTAREQLAAAHLWQRTFLDSADIAIVTTDRAGTVQSFNRAAERMLGYEAQELIGRGAERLHDARELQDRADELGARSGCVIEPGFEVLVAEARAGKPEERNWTWLLRAVLESSIEIARKLRLKCVGEGIETLEDWNCLQQLGCDIGQGYFIARPMQGERLLDWIAARERRGSTAGAI